MLLTGSELSLFTVGFLPYQRLPRQGHRRGRRAVRRQAQLRLAAVRGRRLGTLRRRLDDAGYRSIEVADRYRDEIRAFVARAAAQGKPAAVTELGCTTHRGAADLGGRGDAIIAWDDDGRPLRLRGDPVRDEAEQAGYLRELLEVFDAEGVDSAFVNTFARYDLPHRGDPRQDLDMASYGVVKVLVDRPGRTDPGMAWEPKAAFAALAECYRG